MSDLIIERQKCNRCGVKLPIDHFKLKRDGLRQKNCLQCNKNYKSRHKGCTFSKKCKCRAKFGLEGGNATRCYKHKEDAMVNIINRMCQSKDCKKHAHFNYEGERAIYCAEHMKPNMIDTVAFLCQQDGCYVRSSFNFKGETTPLYCKEHREEGMIDITHSKCQEDGCKKQPGYNYEGEKKGIYCNSHKKEDMVDIINKRCQHDGCVKRAIYNYKGVKKGIYCGEHKKDGMIDITHSKCQEDGCEKRPSHNYKGERKSIYCAQHKKDGMIDIITKRCQEDGCEKKPNFNYEGVKKGIYCGEHKKDGMIDITHSKCQEDGCKKQPGYNYEGEKKGIYCNSHKKDKMIDVKHSLCECGTRAHFGYPSQKPSTCVQHKKDGMIVDSTKRCIENKCKEIAIYGKYHGKHKHCEEHKDEDEINLVEHKCQGTCGLLQPLNENNLCWYCAHPEEGKRVRLAKQMDVKNRLDAEGYKYLSYDRVPYDTNECGLERPDFLFDCNTHFVDLEVDERQHKDRPELCDCNRMINVSQALGLKTVFIRYNPDEYKTSNRNHDPSFNHRMVELKSWLDHYLKNEPTGYCTFIQLYYDGYKKGSVNEVNLDDKMDNVREIELD